MPRNSGFIFRYSFRAAARPILQPSQRDPAGSSHARDMVVRAEMDQVLQPKELLREKIRLRREILARNIPLQLCH